MREAWSEALRLIDAGRHGVLVVVTSVRGHTPQVVGARLIVRDDGSQWGTIGGGAVEAEVVRRARALVGAGAPETASFKLKTELGMCCGGSMEVMMEPFAPTPRVVLFGAGHVAEATARAALLAGFTVVVADDRPDWNTAERFAAPVDRRVTPPLDVLHALDVRASDMLVVLTHDHTLDKQLVEAALRTEAGYVGMIGSRAKAQSTRRHLALADLDEATIARVHMPIGLDILAETPAEIAIAIVGELIRHRRAAASTKSTHGATVTSRSVP